MNIKNMGRFRITKELIEHNPDTVARIFAEMKCVPVRAEALFQPPVIEYFAISELFDEVDEYSRTPEYEIKVSEDEDGNLTVIATRIQEQQP
jgi:hypothetical protein